jgi:hypothetical protein
MQLKMRLSFLDIFDERIIENNMVYSSFYYPFLLLKQFKYKIIYEF